MAATVLGARPNASLRLPSTSSCGTCKSIRPSELAQGVRRFSHRPWDFVTANVTGRLGLECLLESQPVLESIA
eukprot:7364794-Pyramimonas_sp.AAC.1